MGYYFPEKYIGKIEWEKADILMGYYVNEDGMVFLHVHFSPDTEKIRREIYKVLRPTSSDPDHSYSIVKESFKEHDWDIGCFMGHRLSKALEKELTAMDRYSTEQRRRLMEIVRKLFS